MNYRKCFLILATIVMSPALWANIVIHPIHNLDVCKNLSGNWTGKGTVTASIFTCRYNGTAVVTATTLDNSNYSVLISLKVDPSTPLCPSHENVVMPGSCENNNLILQSEDPEVKIDGLVNDSATAADLEGYAYINISGQRLKATITKLHLDKA